MNDPNVTLHPTLVAPFVTPMTTTTTTTATTASADKQHYVINVQIPNMLSAVTYATPPVMSENLASAVSLDKLNINVVNSFDIVPRLSKVGVGVGQ